MALEVTGRIIKIMAPAQGEGRNGVWKKQEFVIETSEQIPRKICASVWGDKVDSFARHQIGEEVKLSVNIESREYNERWYTDIRVWKIDAPGAASNVPPVSYQPSQNQAQAPSQAPVPQFQTTPVNSEEYFAGGDSKEDDLPF